MKSGLYGALAALLLSSCIVRHLVTGPKLTGTCSGACSHYVECKTGAVAEDRTRCETECPDVFSDRDSLMAFESLSCQNAVDVLDGTSPKAARKH
jgi:hypothetical protein